MLLQRRFVDLTDVRGDLLEDVVAPEIATCQGRPARLVDDLVGGGA